VPSVSTLIALTLAVQMVVGVAALEVQLAREVCVERQPVRRISAGVAKVIRDLASREAPVVRTEATQASSFDRALVFMARPPKTDLTRPSPPAAWLLDLPPPSC
jgi:hypothetical protein